MKVSKIQDKDPCPTPRSGHRLVAVGDCVVLFGGYTYRSQTDQGEIKKDVWCYHIPTGAWKHLETDDEHFPKSTASCAVIPYGSKVIVFGGSGVHFGQSNSDKLHVLDMVTLRWETVTFTGSIIEGGYGHSISIANDGYLYIYGGCDGFHYYNTMNKICLKTWHNTTYYRYDYEGKYRHESIEYEGMILIFGGGNPIAREDLGTIPYFCTDTNRWRIMEANSSRNPLGRVAHSCNKIRNYVIVTGGQAQRQNHQNQTIENYALSDVWLFNLESYSWSELSITLPDRIFFHSGAVGRDECLYAFGGSKYNVNGTVERLNMLYKVEVFIPPLVELAWLVFYEHYKFVPRLTMVNMGVPVYLVHRV